MYMNKCNPLLNGRAVWSKGADHAWTSAEHWSCDECIGHWTSNEFPHTFNEQMLSKWEKIRDEQMLDAECLVNEREQTVHECFISNSL